MATESTQSDIQEEEELVGENDQDIGDELVWESMQEEKRENNQNIGGVFVNEGIQEEEERARESDQDIEEELLQEGEEEQERENDHYTGKEILHESTKEEKEPERKNASEENVKEEENEKDTRRVNDRVEKSKDKHAPRGKQKRRRAGELLMDELSSYYQPLAKRRKT